VALCCIGFAVVNIVFELTDRFADGPYAEYSAGLSVMNWLVVGLKAVGVAVALLSIARHPRSLPPAFLCVLLWGAFAMLAAYAAGSVVQRSPSSPARPGTPTRSAPTGGRVRDFLPGPRGRVRRHGDLPLAALRLRKRVIVLGMLGTPWRWA